MPDRMPRLLKPRTDLPIESHKKGVTGTGGFLLIAEPAGFRHRGIDLSYVVEGLSELALEQGFRMNPDDLAKLGIKDGDLMNISVNDLEIAVIAKADEDCPAGVIYFYRPTGFGGLAPCQDLEPLYRLKANPIKVDVRPV
jgi:hypothetical protein